MLCMPAPPMAPMVFQETRLPEAPRTSLSLGFVCHEVCCMCIHGGGAARGSGEAGKWRAGQE